MPRTCPCLHYWFDRFAFDHQRVACDLAPQSGGVVSGCGQAHEAMSESFQPRAKRPERRCLERVERSKIHQPPPERTNLKHDTHIYCRMWQLVRLSSRNACRSGKSKPRSRDQDHLYPLFNPAKHVVVEVVVRRCEPVGPGTHMCRCCPDKTASLWRVTPVLNAPYAHEVPSKMCMSPAGGSISSERVKTAKRSSTAEGSPAPKQLKFSCVHRFGVGSTTIAAPLVQRSPPNQRLASEHGNNPQDAPYKIPSCSYVISSSTWDTNQYTQVLDIQSLTDAQRSFTGIPEEPQESHNPQTKSWTRAPEDHESQAKSRTTLSTLRTVGTSLNIKPCGPRQCNLRHPD